MERLVEIKLLEIPLKFGHIKYWDYFGRHSSSLVMTFVQIIVEVRGKAAAPPFLSPKKTNVVVIAKEERLKQSVIARAYLILLGIMSKWQIEKRCHFEGGTTEKSFPIVRDFSFPTFRDRLFFVEMTILHGAVYCSLLMDSENLSLRWRHDWSNHIIYVTEQL